MSFQHSDQAGKSGDKTSTPPPVRRYRCKLDTVGNVSRELARIYREARSGLIDVSDASKLANVLSIVGRILETSALEDRLAVLEAKGQQ